MTVIENIHFAKTHFSSLIGRVLQGDEVVIAKAGKPLVCIIPYCERHPTGRVPGSARGKITMAADFDAPLPAAELEAWES